MTNLSGTGIKVVNPTATHTFELNEQGLSDLLLRDDVKDRSVVLVSVAGAFRKGKSFLLSFFLRYLNHTYNKKDAGDWLGDKDTPLKGFSWRGGSERHTTGIIMWSEPFLTTLDNGEKVAIFLMDTQGTFDSESTVKDNATIFAFATMLSSVELYNLSQNIEEDDLQHLQLFTDYGRLAQSSASGAPFQRLQLLVRDWSFPYEHRYGAAGGRQLLELRLQIREGQHPELQSIRKHIYACFEELRCFLMPFPGTTVATHPEFDGKLSDIDPEFQTALRELVPMLLARENLILKKIAGQTIKAKELYQYFKSYMAVFNGSDLPEPKSILAATAEANNLSAVSHAIEVYEDLMEEQVGGSRPYLDPASLGQEHSRAKNKAILAFHSKPKMGGSEIEDGYQKKLVKELDERFDQYSKQNEGKNVFRLASTPLALALVMALGLMSSVLGSTLGLGLLVLAGRTVIITSLLVMCVWGFTRVTGQMRDVGLQIDAVSVKIVHYMTRQAVGLAVRELQPAALAEPKKEA